MERHWCRTNERRSRRKNKILSQVRAIRGRASLVRLWMKNENSFYNYLVKLTVCERECFRFCFCDFRTSSAEKASCFLVKIMHLSTERQSLDTCPGLPASLSSRYLLSSAKVELRRPLTSDPNTMLASPTPQTVTVVRAGVTVCLHRWSVVEDASVFH